MQMVVRRRYCSSATRRWIAWTWQAGATGYGVLTVPAPSSIASSAGILPSRMRIMQIRLYTRVIQTALIEWTGRCYDSHMAA
jgi:hypothetical protein